jgi:hypothetical protein
MSNPDLDPTRVAELSVLVNPERIRSSIKRLFHNRIDEVIGELLQNSQRSGSTTVVITTTENSFTVADNGHGLIGDIQGFHTLLKLAESRFDNETIEDQDPMGVGIVSLLTHDQISEVTFSSGSLELTIDTKRWWDDPDYYSVWYERLVNLDQPVAGLRISATCKPELVEAIQKSLQAKDTIYTFSDEIYRSASPAQGYEGILTITLNGENVRTSLPTWTTIQRPLVSTTFKGSKLTIGYTNTHRSSVLWYGQLILIRGFANSAFSFHLEVSSGRPINPLSPSRTGIINDAAYTELLNFVKEQIFKFIFDPANRKRISAAHVEACYKLDEAYATANSPYFVAESVETNDSYSSLEEFNGTADFSPATTIKLFTYDNQPLLLNAGVTVQLSTGTTEAEYGLHSFLAETGPLHTLRCGNATRTTIGTLWWKPEGKPIHDWFYNPGVYGISYNDDNPPDKWKPIANAPVFAFSDPSSYDAGEVDFIVGSTAPLDFLNNQVWAGFSYNDEHDYDPQEESFRDSVDHIIRTIIGNCVPRDFKLHQLSQFLKDPSAPIMSVVYHFAIAGKFVNPRRIYKPSKKNTGGAMSPSEITVKSATGEKVRLKLY